MCRTVKKPASAFTMEQLSAEISRLERLKASYTALQAVMLSLHVLMLFLG
jgi:hypothetical protein